MGPTGPIRYERVNEAIIIAADQSIPKTKNSNSEKKSNPWWNEDCETAIKKAKKDLYKLKKKKKQYNNTTKLSINASRRYLKELL